MRTTIKSQSCKLHKIITNKADRYQKEELFWIFTRGVEHTVSDTMETQWKYAQGNCKGKHE